MQFDLIAVVSAVLAGVGTLIALLGYISQQAKSLREVITSGDRAAAEAASKSVTELASSTTHAHTVLRADVETLKRESVRREELTALEHRNAALMDRLEAKIDRIFDQLTQVAALSAKLDILAKRKPIEE